MAKVGEIKEIPKELDIEWKIPKFDLSSNIGYHSPFFSFAGKSWVLWIYPNSCSGRYVGIYLVDQSDTPSKNLEVFLGLRMFDEKKGTEMLNATYDVDSTDRSCYLPRSELLQNESVLLPSNDVTVLCTLKYSGSVEDQSGTETPKCPHCKELMSAKDISAHEKMCVNKPIKCPECSKVVALKNWYDHKCEVSKTKGKGCTLGPFINPRDNKVLRDFKELFVKKEDCDVVMKVQGQEFLAHRNILKARSSVFASTFRHDMKEKASGVVEIEDCDPASFSDFLCFLYCGDTEVICEGNVFGLFTAADKYDVQDLREDCMKFVKSNLSVHTFCDTAVLALRHSETDLIKLTTDFFLENAVEIIKTVQWQSFLAENTTVGNELFLKFASNSSSLNK